MRTLAEAASGWCEADSEERVPEASGVAGCGEADSKDTVSETCGLVVPFLMPRCLLHCLLAFGEARPGLGLGKIGGLTWPGSCTGFQFLFVAAMLGAIAFAAFFGCFFLNLVPFPGCGMERLKGKDKAPESILRVG